MVTPTQIKENRPVFLNLLQIHFPVAAVMSIIHRITGVVMGLSIIPLIWLFDLSLGDQQGFSEAARLYNSLPIQLILPIALWGLMHHLLAGIRYLFIDAGIGVERALARGSAWAVMLCAPILALLLWAALP